MKFSHIIKNVVSSFVFALLPLSVSAKCGNVDYSWGADALAGMHDYVVTMMLYVLYLTYAVAAVMVIISALQIYIKMNTGEDGVTVAAEVGSELHRPHGAPVVIVDHHHCAAPAPPRPYFKPGVDTPMDVAARNFEAAMNQEVLHPHMGKGL